MEELMKKSELSALLKSVCAAVNEGISSEANRNVFPRAVYWAYAEEDVLASGESYVNKATYQVSIYARTPQCDVYKSLREKLKEVGLHPVFYHEYVENDPVYSKCWHTYFAIEVLEES